MQNDIYPEAAVLVIFGAAGDLTWRKLVPALYDLFLDHAIGWTLVDEHRHGTLIVAFGENRYLGGQNASSLNVDFAIPDTDLFAGEHAIVAQGRVVVE